MKNENKDKIENAFGIFLGLFIAILGVIFGIVWKVAIPVFIVFLILKLVGVITFSWFWVCFPLIVMVVSLLFAILIDVFGED